MADPPVGPGVPLEGSYCTLAFPGPPACLCPPRLLSISFDARRSHPLHTLRTPSPMAPLRPLSNQPPGLANSHPLDPWALTDPRTFGFPRYLRAGTPDPRSQAPSPARARSHTSYPLCAPRRHTPSSPRTPLHPRTPWGAGAALGLAAET